MLARFLSFLLWGSALAVYCPVFQYVVDRTLPDANDAVDFGTKTSVGQCRDSCAVDPSCKTAVAHLSSITSTVDNCWLSPSAFAVKEYGHMNKSVLMVKRDDGLLFVGSRFCGVKMTGMSQGGGISFCRKFPNTQMATATTADEALELVMILREKNVGEAWVRLNYYSSTRSNPNWWTPNGSVRFSSAPEVLEIVDFENSESGGFWALNLVNFSRPTLSQHQSGDLLPFICCSPE